MKKFDESVANLNLKLTVKLEAMKIQCISDQDAARIMQAEPLLQFKWEELELKVISVDRKSRVIGLSIKAKDVDEEKEAIRQHRQQDPVSTSATTIGDLIKAKMDDK